MNKIIPFDSFDRSLLEFKHPDFLFSKEHQCLKVSGYYLFLESGAVIKEGDEKINEFLGMDLTAMLPKTVSDWAHIGVDVISGIADVAGLFTFGGASVASLVIDYLHAVAYFIEASRDPENELSLQIGGVLTALFANIPVVGNIGGGLVKALFKLAKGITGGIFGLIFKRIPRAAIPAIVGFLKDGGKSVVSKITAAFAKMNEGKLGKMLMKVPAVAKIVNYAKGGGFAGAFTNATRHLTTDLAIYSRSTVHQSESMIRESYKLLDAPVRQVLTMGEYTLAHGQMLQKQITGVPHSIDITKASATEIAQMEQSLAKFFSKKATPQEALQAAINSNVKVINKEYLATLKATAPEAGASALSKWARLFPKKVVETAAKDSKSLGSGLWSWAMRKLASRVARVAGRVALMGAKNAVSNTFNPAKVDDTAASQTTSNTTASEPDKYAAGTVGSRGQIGVDELEKDPKVASSSDDAISTGNSENGGSSELKTETVASKEQLGDLTIAFKTPNKDNTEGKLVLSGEMYADDVDLSAKLSSYTDRESLLADLKLVLNKEDKERIRDGEFAKWERSTALNTPFIEQDNASYEFYFMVRERSTISLAKKRINERFDWENILTEETLAKGFCKFSNSLYMRITKKEKGNESS